MYKKNLNIGDQFNEWTVIKELEQRKFGHLLYLVKCSCGNESELAGYYLRANKSKYCRSCSTKKRIPKGDNNKFYKHGASMKDNPIRPTYKIWVVMRQRCLNYNSKDYKNYGARGISFCKNWETFEGFINDMGICPKNLSLERIDNDGNYCKENCKWATREEQNNNRRDNTFFMIDGKKVIRTHIQKIMNWTRSMYRRRQEKYGDQWIIDQYKSSI